MATTNEILNSARTQHASTTAIVPQALVDAVGLNIDHIAAVSTATRFQNCTTCLVPMELIGQGLECPVCHGIVQVYGDIKDCSEDAVGIIKTSYGGRNTFQSNGGNKPQRKQTLAQLVRFNEDYTGIKFPLSALESTADTYNDLQKTNIDIYDTAGNVIGSKKFVKRSNIKDEIIGAILYQELIKRGCSRKRKDIAEFMQLQSNGISRGETILRELAPASGITLSVNADPSSDFPKRYLTALDLYKTDEYGDVTAESEANLAFVTMIVSLATKHRIAWNSIQSSKTVGAIALLVAARKLDIDGTKISEACDGVRKNTFTKFTKEVTNHKELFQPAYDLLQ